MTAGRGCVSQAQDRTCAWPARVANWFNATFPNQVEVSNIATGGMTARVWAQSLGLRAYSMGSAMDNVDVVLFETAINDNGLGVTNYEALIRLIIDCFPNSTPFGVLVAPETKYRLVKQQAIILEHYDLPNINFNLDVMGPLGEEVWGKLVHPDCRKHQHLADAITNTIVRGACRNTAWTRPRFALPLTVQPQTIDLDQYDAMTGCRKPKSMYSSILGNGTALGPRMYGDWHLGEDTPGKPGWISTKPGS